MPAPGKLALYPSTVQKLLTTNRDIISDTAAPDHDEILENNLPPITIDIKEDKHLKQVKELQHRYKLTLFKYYNNLEVFIYSGSC